VSNNSKTAINSNQNRRRHQGNCLEGKRNEYFEIQPVISRFSLCLLAWCALATVPAFAQTITHVPLFTFNGDSAADFFGDSVSGAGDVNGDGFADVIVGADGDDNNGFSSGSARVFSGSDGTVLYTFDGDSAGDNFGESVSGAGDVNGDGFADLIVGAFRDDNNGSDSGSARVFSGVDGSVLYTFDGDASDNFGESVSGAGDVNGDGFADVIAGAVRDDNNGAQSGSARVFSGIDGSVLYTFDGNSVDDFFGASVRGGGDVNGDGFADVIVGARTDIFFGQPFFQVFSGFDGSILYTFFSNFLDELGTSVSIAGDVNGDGFADLIAGAPSDDNNGTLSGRAFVLSGFDGSVLYAFNGDFGDRFGASVSGAGDVNGDGFVDVIVGARFDDNNGSNSGSARVFSGADGSVLYTFDGDSSDDRFGTSVSDAGDVNGDGLGDFIVGTGRGGANSGGYARLFVSQIAASIILGDVNEDGEVTFADIPSFIQVLQAGTFLPEADCNEDGAVNFADIPAFIEILQGG